MNEKMKGINRLALLSISFLLTTGYTIAPAIPLMLRSFPNQTEAQIQLLVTVPAFSIMIMVLFSDKVTKLFSEKLTVQIGLALVAIFGPLPIILNSYSSILFSRILLGFGLSLIAPLAVSLISYFFSGKEMASMMGFRSASESIGQSLLTLLSGYLIAFGGWKSSFLVYFMAIPVLILVTIYIPPINIDKQKSKTEKDSKPKLSLSIIFYAFAIFIVIGSYIGIRIRIPLIMEQRGIGREIESSQISSMIPFLGLVMGIFFGKIYGLFRKYIIIIGTTLMTSGYLIVAVTTSYWEVFLGGFIVGVGYPLVLSGTFTIVSTIALKGAENFSTSIILLGINAGAFLSPYLLQWIGMLTKSTSLTSPFYIYSVLLITFGILSHINIRKTDSLNKKSIKK